MMKLLICLLLLAACASLRRWIQTSAIVSINLKSSKSILQASSFARDECGETEAAIPMFPYGESGFRTIMADGSFCIDKTSHIRTLETSGKYLKMWRPRRFGKTLVCDMLAEYYDASNSADQLEAMFGETDIMRKQLPTKEMGKYLVLRLSFSGVAPDKDIERNFRDCINDAVQDFSEKYVKAGLLDDPINVNPENCLSSLQRLFSKVKNSKVKNSRRQIYLIVDECDSFVNRLLLSVDTSKPDLGLKEYEDVVSGEESMLRNWGNVIKEGTVGSTIARAFFTGVAPQAFSDGLSSLNMVKDITSAPEVWGLFGLTAAEVSCGLRMIRGLTAEQCTKHLEHMRALYDGYRFTRTQTEPLFNTQYVLYFLDHLNRNGSPPESLIDPAVSGPIDNVAEYIIANYKSSSLYTLRNFALGIMAPHEMAIFKREVAPSFRSKALFDQATVSEALISLAYFHGFLTYKFDKDSNSILTSPNVLMQTVFVRALLLGMPEQRMNQLETIISSAKPDMMEFNRIATLGVEEAVKAAGGDAGKNVKQLVAKVISIKEIFE